MSETPHILVVQRAAFSDVVQRIYNDISHVSFEQGTTGGQNSRRVSSIAWLQRTEPRWQWLNERLAEWMQAATGMLLPGPQPDSVQLTRYGVGGKYDWHADRGNRNTRELSATVLLHAATSGGALEFRGIDRLTELELNVGDAVVFDSRIEHRVTPVKAGRRDSLVCWLSGPSGSGP